MTRRLSQDLLHGSVNFTTTRKNVFAHLADDGPLSMHIFLRVGAPKKAKDQNRILEILPQQVNLAFETCTMI